MAKPAVIIVGADKGGVGKTTVARTLLDYFGAHQTPTRAFDTEAPRGTLHRFHPEKTEEAKHVVRELHDKRHDIASSGLKILRIQLTEFAGRDEVQTDGLSLDGFRSEVKEERCSKQKEKNRAEEKEAERARGKTHLKREKLNRVLTMV